MKGLFLQLLVPPELLQIFSRGFPCYFSWRFQDEAFFLFMGRGEDLSQDQSLFTLDDDVLPRFERELRRIELLYFSIR